MVCCRSKPYLAPYSGCTIADFLRDIGEPTLIIYDDLSIANSDLSLGFSSQEAGLRALECIRLQEDLAAAAFAAELHDSLSLIGPIHQ